MNKNGELVTTPIHVQTYLDLKPVKEGEIDGVGMGILKDGTPYLTARGLARMCGIDHTLLLDLANEWDVEKSRPRGRKIASILAEQGFKDPIAIKVNIDNQPVHAFTDFACMAILEYYAFEAGLSVRETARKNYRLIARSSLRAFVYGRLGYDPQELIPDPWKKFHDRMMLNYNEIPLGFFSIFKELAEFVFFLIQQGMQIDEHTVPDLSVGKLWGTFWKETNGDEKFGPRTKHPHNFPDYFSQSVSNPVDAWVYPDAALGEFRLWLRTVYLPENFPNYLRNKVGQGFFPPSKAEILLEAITSQKQIKSS